MIASNPGNPDDVNDERSQAALKEFQQKNGLKPTGIADPTTRKKLEAEAKKARAAAGGGGATGGGSSSAAAGGSAPAAPATPAVASPPRPAVHNLYWATGWAREGEKVKLHVKAPPLAGKSLAVTLRNAASKKESAVVATLAVAKKKGKGTVEIEIPGLAAIGLGDRADGASWAEIEARASDGTVEATTGAPLYVDGTAGDWDDYVGEPACAEEAVEKVVKARAARNLARFSIGWKNARYGDGYQFVSQHDDESAEGKEFRRRVRARLESIIDASSGDRKRLRQARAFFAFQDIEGTISDINAYDGQIVTWGVGFGGHGQLPDIIARMTKDRAVVDLWHECGLRFTGDAKTCSFDVLDVERKVVVSGQDPALRVIASKDPGDVRREPPELLQLLIHTAYAHTDLAVDAQLEGFRAKAGDVGHDERIKNQSLFTAIAHIRHWLPAYGANPRVKWAHERAVADGAPEGPSDDTDRRIAHWFVYWFCGRMLRAGKDPAGRWDQLRENFIRMKDRKFNPRAEDELLDIGGDPLFLAKEPPTVPEEVLATIPKP